MPIRQLPQATLTHLRTTQTSYFDPPPEKLQAGSGGRGVEKGPAEGGLDRGAARALELGGLNQSARRQQTPPAPDCSVAHRQFFEAVSTIAGASYLDATVLLSRPDYRSRVGRISRACRAVFTLRKMRRPDAAAGSAERVHR